MVKVLFMHGACLVWHCCPFAERKGLVTLNTLFRSTGMCNKYLLGRVDAVNKKHVFVVGYQLRVDNILPETSLGLNSRVQWHKSVLKL